MRFAAVQHVPDLPQRTQAAEFLRRLVTPELAASKRETPVRPDDVPCDLDQRVRLVGEW